MSVFDKFVNKRVLVTGGGGYLATNLITRLSDTHCHIFRLDRACAKFVPIVGNAIITDISGDVREESSWNSILDGIDIVFHFAAQTSLRVAEDNPVEDLVINVVPMIHLLETCRRRALHPIVLFAGTATEVGLPSHLPVDETHIDLPITIYDLHKLMAENYLKHYIRGGIVRGAILRLANVYGPGPTSSSADRGVMNAMVLKALRGEMLSVYGDGKCLRDYIYIDDVVEAFLAAVASIDQLNGRHYVIGSGEGHRIVDAFNLIAERVAAKNGSRVQVIHVEPPASLSAIESRNFVADSTRINLATGWRATHNLVQGIDQTIDYFSLSPNARKQ